MSIDATSSVFGESNKEAVNNLKARVCGSEGPMPLPENGGCRHYFSLNMKIKEEFEDTHNIIDTLNNVLAKIIEEEEQMKV